MSNSQPIQVSVVIVSYNVCGFVLDAIKSVYTYLKYPVQIILVDNKSTDGTVQEVKKQYPDVEVVANTDNRGFSAANNQAFALCKGDIIMMLNPDAAFINESINLIIEELVKQSEKDVLIGPRIVNPDLSYQASCWKFPSPIQHLLELLFLNKLIDTTSYHANDCKQQTRVDFLSGACIVFSKKTLNKLSGLDENLFWMDDVDFCRRNIELGGENYYYPSSAISHCIGQSSKKNQRVVISNQIISKLKYYCKHNLFGYYVMSVPIFLLQIVTRLPLFLILGIARPFYFQKAQAYAYTLKRLIIYLITNKQTVVS